MHQLQTTVLLRKDEEAWTAFARRIENGTGEAIVVFGAADAQSLTPDDRRALIRACAGRGGQLSIATRDLVLASAARKERIRVYDRTRDLRRALAGHPDLAEVLRAFSPSLWRAHWRSRLQRMGLLSLPRLRIWFLILLSGLLFLFVTLRLLPSAEVRVWPRKSAVSETANIYLVQSGALLPVPDAPNALPLVPITAQVTTTVPITEISTLFTGTSAEMTVDLFNKTDEDVSIRKGTRLANQAGMVFRTLESADVPAGGHARTRARAADEDIYGESIGARGNVPAGLRWELPGLPAEDRRLVYAQNVTAGAGGRTSSRRVLTRQDIERARDGVLKKLLLREAQEIVQRRIQLLTNAGPGREWQFFDKSDVIRETYSGFVLPTDKIGSAVASAHITGSLSYTVYAYDAGAIVALFARARFSGRSEDQRVLPESLQTSRLRVYVIAFDDGFLWIKVTADLSALQEYVLDPLSPAGASFATRVRSQVTGQTVGDALRLVRNLPEVDRAEIAVWPPWSKRLPAIPAHISVVPQSR